MPPLIPLCSARLPIDRDLNPEKAAGMAVGAWIDDFVLSDGESLQAGSAPR
jgi:hypothetical protein